MELSFREYIRNLYFNRTDTNKRVYVIVDSGKEYKLKFYEYYEDSIYIDSGLGIIGGYKCNKGLVDVGRERKIFRAIIPSDTRIVDFGEIVKTECVVIEPYYYTPIKFLGIVLGYRRRHYRE